MPLQQAKKEEREERSVCMCVRERESQTRMEGGRTHANFRLDPHLLLLLLLLLFLLLPLPRTRRASRRRVVASVVVIRHS